MSPRVLDGVRVWLHRQLARGARLHAEQHANHEFLRLREHHRLFLLLAEEQGWDLAKLVTAPPAGRAA